MEVVEAPALVVAGSWPPARSRSVILCITPNSVPKIASYGKLRDWRNAYSAGGRWEVGGFRFFFADSSWRAMTSTFHS